MLNLLPQKTERRLRGGQQKRAPEAETGKGIAQKQHGIYKVGEPGLSGSRELKGAAEYISMQFTYIVPVSSAGGEPWPSAMSVSLNHELPTSGSDLWRGNALRERAAGKARSLYIYPRNLNNSCSLGHAESVDYRSHNLGGKHYDSPDGPLLPRAGRARPTDKLQKLLPLEKLLLPLTGSVMISQLPVKRRGDKPLASALLDRRTAGRESLSIRKRHTGFGKEEIVEVIQYHSEKNRNRPHASFNWKFILSGHLLKY